MKYNPFKYWWNRTKSDKVSKVLFSALAFIIGALLFKVNVDWGYFVTEDSRVLGGLFYWLVGSVIFGTFRGIVSLLIVWGCYKDLPNAKIAYNDCVKQEKVMNNIDYDKLREIFKLGKEKV